MKAKIEDFKAIQELFVQDVGGKPLTTAYVDDFLVQRLFLKYVGEEAENELMLRLNTRTKQLVVARVLFERKRVGHCTKLVQLLEEYARQHGYKEIVFESVHTDEMRNFLIKHRFENDISPMGLNFDWVRKLEG